MWFDTWIRSPSDWHSCQARCRAIRGAAMVVQNFVSTPRAPSRFGVAHLGSGGGRASACRSKVGVKEDRFTRLADPTAGVARTGSDREPPFPDSAVEPVLWVFQPNGGESARTAGQLGNLAGRKLSRAPRLGIAAVFSHHANSPTEAMLNQGPPFRACRPSWSSSPVDRLMSPEMIASQTGRAGAHDR